MATILGLPQPAQEALDTLMEGHRRFLAGKPENFTYEVKDLTHLAVGQKPIAAIIACSDSRGAPEIVFDQPLGTIFSSRVPGNVAADSARWMLEIAVKEFQIPLVMVIGHTGCLAVGQLLDGDKGGEGGPHRFAVSNAVYRAKTRRTADLYRSAIEENVAQTVEHLIRDSNALRGGMLEQRIGITGAVYNMETGGIDMLEIQSQLYGRI